jgi:hypothetical protein
MAGPLKVIVFPGPFPEPGPNPAPNPLPGPVSQQRCNALRAQLHTLQLKLQQVQRIPVGTKTDANGCIIG